MDSVVEWLSQPGKGPEGGRRAEPKITARLLLVLPLRSIALSVLVARWCSHLDPMGLRLRGQEERKGKS